MRPLSELYIRRKVCKGLIYEVDHTSLEEVATVLEIPLEEAEAAKADVMEFYKEQLATIDAEITAQTGKPPAQVVKLQTAHMFGKGGSISHG